MSSVKVIISVATLAALICIAPTGASADANIPTTKCTAGVKLDDAASISITTGNVAATMNILDEGAQAYLKCAETAAGPERWSDELNAGNDYMSAGIEATQADAAGTATEYYEWAKSIFQAVEAENPSAKFLHLAAHLLNQLPTSQAVSGQALPTNTTATWKFDLLPSPTPTPRRTPRPTAHPTARPTPTPAAAALHTTLPLSELCRSGSSKVDDAQRYLFSTSAYVNSGGDASGQADTLASMYEDAAQTFEGCALASTIAPTYWQDVRAAIVSFNSAVIFAAEYQFSRARTDFAEEYRLFNMLLGGADVPPDVLAWAKAQVPAMKQLKANLDRGSFW